MEIYDDVQHFFCSILQNCLDVYAPLRLSSKKSRRPTPWMTPSLLIAIKDKKQAKRKVEMSHNSNDIVVYKQIKNRLKILVCEGKLTYLQTLLLDTKKDPIVLQLNYGLALTILLIVTTAIIVVLLIIGIYL